MSLAVILLAVGAVLMAVGSVATFAAGWHGMKLEDAHLAALLYPEHHARATRRTIRAARVAFHVAAFGLGLLIAAGVAAIFDAVAAAT